MRAVLQLEMGVACAGRYETRASIMSAERTGGVFEMKFPLDRDKVGAVLDWMRTHLAPDPHGSGEHRDTYLVQSLYLDTPKFDVFHRRGSFGRAKFRIRRYGTHPEVFLERKLKRGGIVRKRRVPVDERDLEHLHSEANGTPWPGSWFHHRLHLRQLMPMTRMNYLRVARFGVEGARKFRVTLDRELHVARADGMTAPGVVPGEDLLRGGAVLEVKFADTMPAVVRRLVEEQQLLPGPFSKYRIGVQACGLVSEPAPDAEPTPLPGL